MKNGRISQWNYETSLNYHGNWKPIRQFFLKYNEIQPEVSAHRPDIHLYRLSQRERKTLQRRGNQAIRLAFVLDKSFQGGNNQQICSNKNLEESFQLGHAFVHSPGPIQQQHKILVLKYSRITNKLTDSTVPPFKARLACASIVIHHISACSIVCTRVRITIIGV